MRRSCRSPACVRPFERKGRPQAWRPHGRGAAAVAISRSSCRDRVCSAGPKCALCCEHVLPNLRENGCQPGFCIARPAPASGRDHLTSAESSREAIQYSADRSKRALTGRRRQSEARLHHVFSNPVGSLWRSVRPRERWFGEEDARKASVRCPAPDMTSRYRPRPDALSPVATRLQNLAAPRSGCSSQSTR